MPARCPLCGGAALGQLSVDAGLRGFHFFTVLDSTRTVSQKEVLDCILGYFLDMQS